MALFTDTFTAANNDLLNGRSGWTLFSTGATDTPLFDGSGALKTGGADPDGGGLQGQDHGSADHFAQVNWGANAILSLGANLALAVRATDRSTHIGARYVDAYGAWYIMAVGGAGALANAAKSAPTSSTVVRLTAEGTAIKLYVDDMVTPLISTTHSNVLYDSVTQCGLVVRTASAQTGLMSTPYYSGLIADIGDIGGDPEPGGQPFAKRFGGVPGSALNKGVW